MKTGAEILATAASGEDFLALVAALEGFCFGVEAFA